jgi:uncharacterized MAPEG superfamily protein
MNKNMGNLDKLIRVLLAMVFVVLYLTGTVTGTLGLALVAIAVLFILTSIVSFCPLYTIFGINTCSIKK